LAKAGFTARSAHASGDLREIDLEGAHLHLPLDAGKGTEPNAGPGIDVAVGSLRLRGLSPFTHASSVPPLGRAIALALAVTLAAAFCVVGVLSGALRGRLHAIVTAATGSLATLGTMRAIDRAGGTGLATILVPSVALAALLLVAVVSSRLPRGRWAATK
jgi:hypothetical protein